MPDAEREVEQLWAQVFGEAPSISASLDLLTRVLVEALPSAPPYQPAPPSPEAQVPVQEAAEAAVYRRRRAG